MDTQPSSPVGDHAHEDPPPSASAPEKRRVYNRRPKQRTEGITSYTTAFVPGLYNVKNPPGDFGTKESNIEVIHQLSVARAAKEKEARDQQRKEEASANGEANGEEKEEIKEVVKETADGVPLSRILIIHPGSRNLRLGRASDFYPHEVPNCIARPANVPGGFDPPVLGKRTAEEAVETNIGLLRDYLRNRLRANKLTTDWRDGARVNAANGKVKPESIPEHNDPYRIDWTELDGRRYVVGTDALRLPVNSGYRVRYPILQRRFNSRDWASLQLLLDDMTIILQESLRTELGIKPIDYKQHAVVLVVPDYGDRLFVTEFANILLNVMGFREIAIHQESYCAIFSAGMSSACVVDIGAQQISVTCIEEGTVNPDTRMALAYGSDDITVALTQLLQRASFPYRDLDLARAQDWVMMDNLKIRVCTLEEHLVANTPWDFYVVSDGLTQKYLLRTYDENVLAPLCFFDTRMIDFDTKRGEAFRLVNPDISDLIKSSYNEPTGAMKTCTSHLLPSRAEAMDVSGDSLGVPTAASLPASQEATPASPSQPTPKPTSPSTPAAHTPVPEWPQAATPVPNLAPTAAQSQAATPVPDADGNDEPSYDIVFESSRTPLDGAIAASISQCANENKVKTAASSVLLVGGGSALKGLGPFIAERLPPLLRQRGYPIDHVQIVPPPRGLNPKFMSWKGASVMCNLEGLSDMWIRQDEFAALGGRLLKDRLVML